MAKKRVYEIAKEKGVSSKDLIAALKAAGVEVKAAASTVDEAVATQALSSDGAGNGKPSAPATAARKPADAKAAAPKPADASHRLPSRRRHRRPSLLSNARSRVAAPAARHRRRGTAARRGPSVRPRAGRVGAAEGAGAAS
jgi:translation initiation factor IF-2